MHLFTVHDSTLLPMLIALDCFDGHWPPFSADITFEIYSQTSGSPVSEVIDQDEASTENTQYPNSTINWSASMLDSYWVRVKYINKPMPLARFWGIEKQLKSFLGSDEFVPLRLLAQRWSQMSLIPTDYVEQCRRVAGRAQNHHKGLGPKNI